MPVAVVTGGSSGIGLAVARALQRRGGWRLVLAARDAERLDAASAALGARAVVCDIGDDAQVAALAAAAGEEGGCDLLVQSAGVPGHVGLEAPVDVYRRVLATNYVGLVRVGHALWPQLVERRGRMANVVSVAGTVPLARTAPYSVSKHAALAYSRALAAAGRREGVRVTTVNPGPVVTPGFPQRALLASRVRRMLAIDADRCAAGLLDAVDRGAAEVFVPGWWRLAAAAEALVPAATARFAARHWGPSTGRLAPEPEAR